MHQYTMQEAKKLLVDGFVGTATRIDLWATLEKFYKELPRPATTEFRIDGSFVTSKLSPDDIDLVLFFRDDADAMTVSLIERLIQRYAPSLHVFCFAQRYSGLKPVENFFMKDRLNRPKGMVKVVVL